MVGGWSVEFIFPVAPTAWVGIAPALGARRGCSGVGEGDAIAKWGREGC